MCGWCSLEAKCSRQGLCKNKQLRNRWIQEDQQCLSITFHVDQTIVDINNPQMVRNNDETTMSVLVLQLFRCNL